MNTKPSHTILSIWMLILCPLSGNVWTTGILEPNDGAFGTPGSITASNTINTTVGSANVSLASSASNFFRTTGAPNITNNELAPYFEGIHSAPITLTLTSDTGLTNFEMLLHNIYAASTQNRNYFGNFTLTFADGTVINNATPNISLLNSTSHFSIDPGTNSQPTGLNPAFNGSNILSQSTLDPDGTGPAPNANYIFDPSPGNVQGSGIITFDESLATGGITKVEMTYIDNLSRNFTGMIGFAANVIPEPSTTLLTAIATLSLISTRRRH